MKEHWEFIVGMLAIGMTVWTQVKTWTTWFRRLFIRTCYMDYTTGSNLAAYLASIKETPAIEAVYGTFSSYIRPLGRWGSVAREFRTFGNRRMWYKNRPIWLRKDKDSPHDEYRQRCEFIRGTVDIEKLLIETTEWVNKTGAQGHTTNVTRHVVVYHHGTSLGAELAEQRSGTKYVEENYGSAYRFLGWKNTDIGNVVHARSLTALSLPPNLAKLAELVKRWKDAKEWYKKRGIPHRRGFLLHGIPGTGKTSFVRALSEEHDLPVHVIDLATMSNSELRKAWNKAVADAPCSILIEDIDAVFHGRENVAAGAGLASSGGLTYDALLNCIDGVERHDGILVFITTNHLEKIDRALTDRPGRIDHVVEFIPLGFEERLQIAIRILEDETVARSLTESYPDCPAAEFVDVCCRQALERLYDSPAPAAPHMNGKSKKTLIDYGVDS